MSSEAQTPRVGDAFADVLRAGRTQFNEQFEHARRQNPELEGGAFGAFLADVVDPWVEATEETTEATAVVAVAQTGFEAGLELVAQRLAGPGARLDAMDDGLRLVLPTAAELTAADPLRALTAVANALCQIETEIGPGAAMRWAEGMAADRVLDRLTGLDSWLEYGQVLAWRCGLAHYRTSALEVGATLGSQDAGWLACAALEIDQDSDWSVVAARLRSDPWHVPTAESDVRPRLVHRVGGFRGFGGPFVEPPRVAVVGDALVAFGGDEGRVVTADAFGCTLHRASDDEVLLAMDQVMKWPTTKKASESVARQIEKSLDLPAGWSIEDEVLHTGNEASSPTLDLSTEGRWTSAVRVGPTLAVTTDASHHVLLVALPVGDLPVEDLPVDAAGGSG